MSALCHFNLQDALKFLMNIFSFITFKIKKENTGSKGTADYKSCLIVQWNSTCNSGRKKAVIHFCRNHIQEAGRISDSLKSALLFEESL